MAHPASFGWLDGPCSLERGLSSFRRVDPRFCSSPPTLRLAAKPSRSDRSVGGLDVARPTPGLGAHGVPRHGERHWYGTALSTADAWLLLSAAEAEPPLVQPVVGVGAPGSRRSARSAARTNGLDAGVAPATCLKPKVAAWRCGHDVPGGRGSVRRQTGVRGSEPQVGNPQVVAPVFPRPSRPGRWAKCRRGSVLRRRSPGTS